MAAAKKEFTLYVHVVEARGLATADVPGLKTYCKVKVYGAKKKYKTAEIDKTNNPTYNDVFPFFLNEVHYGMHMVCKCWARQGPLISDQFVGKVSVPLAQFNEGTDYIEGWFDFQNVNLTGRANGSLYLRVGTDQNYARLPKSELPRLKAHARTLLNERSLTCEAKSADGAKRTASIFVGTWNVGNKPPPDDLSPWLPRDGHDVVAIGTQECEYKPRRPHRTVQADWEAALTGHFGEAYILIGSYKLLEMRLQVFVAAASAHLVHDVQFSTEATGLAGVYGNKGGVAISLNIMDTTVCFLNSHLAAHQHQKKKRNEDVSEIIRGVRLGLPDADVLHQFTHVIWMGDLNYRLDFGDQGDEKTPDPELHKKMVAMISAGGDGLKELFATDQLTAEMREGNVMRGFQEGDYTTFAPTFKVLRGVEFGYTEQRSPAWCDRVLWRSIEGHIMRQTSLTAAPGITTSDHKPVASTFELELHRLPAGITDAIGECTIKISGLSGRGLRAADISGTSDPFVRFMSPVLRRSVQTAYKPRTLSPDWADVDIPPLDLSLNNPKRINLSIITLVIYDWDRGKENDIIGHAALNLGSFVPASVDEALKRSGEPQPFELEVTFGGLPAGSLSGIMTVNFAEPSFQPFRLDEGK